MTSDLFIVREIMKAARKIDCGVKQDWCQTEPKENSHNDQMENSKNQGC